MAKFLLEKHPENLLGGDSLKDGQHRCQDFWVKFRSYQPNHAIYKYHQDWSKVIPICIHGDKGRTLKKTPVANYSWESVWGLPANLRTTDDEAYVKKRMDAKYELGHLGKACCERPAWQDCEEAAAQCTIKRRRLSENADKGVQTHNSLGALVLLYGDVSK